MCTYSIYFNPSRPRLLPTCTVNLLLRKRGTASAFIIEEAVLSTQLDYLHTNSGRLCFREKHSTM